MCLICTILNCTMENTVEMQDEHTQAEDATGRQAMRQGASGRQPSIAAVIVTRSRLILLRECLAAVQAQTRAPDEIIVIDNASDDGTREWLAEQSGLTVILQGNLGGAGGFSRGMKEGYERGHDWFWCMDDDTIARPDALEKLCATPQFRDARTGYLGSIVQWTDGSLHKMNMWLSAHVATPNVEWYNNLLRDKCVPSETSTFVSILVSRRAVEKVGLPIQEMFIWCDDAEYTYRVSRAFSNYHVLDSIVVHKTPTNKGGSLETATPADYFKLKYGLRNEVYFRRVQTGNKVFKTTRLGVLLVRQSIVLLKNRAPMYLLKALWSGLFFSPRIERVRPPRSKQQA